MRVDEWKDVAAVLGIFLCVCAVVGALLWVTKSSRSNKVSDYPKMHVINGDDCTRISSGTSGGVFSCGNLIIAYDLNDNSR